MGLENPYPDMSQTPQGEGCIGCGSNGILTIDDNSRMAVSGWRVRCRWDSVLISCGDIPNLLHLGLAIPANETNQRGLGGSYTEEVTYSTGPGYVTTHNEVRLRKLERKPSRLLPDCL